MLSIDTNKISCQGMTQQLFLVLLANLSLSFVYSRLIIHHFHLITPQVDWHTSFKVLYMQGTSSLASQH